MKARLSGLGDNTVLNKDINRAERRKRFKRFSRNEKLAYRKRESAIKFNDMFNSLIKAIREKAVSVKVDTCIDKMYFCINTRNYKDTLIIRYEGNEMLKSNLGVKTNVTLDNGIERLDNILIYVEVLSDNRVSIDDGKGVYLNDITK